MRMERTRHSVNRERRGGAVERYHVVGIGNAVEARTGAGEDKKALWKCVVRTAG